MRSIFDEFIEVVTTREELDELADRRFVLGLLFARRLRPQLQSEESGRERDC